jgi:ketosteroid isomerase-like protein
VTVETLRRLVDAFNAHDLDAVMGFFTDDCVLEMPAGAASVGAEAPGPGGRAIGTGEPLRRHPRRPLRRRPPLGQRRPGCSEWLLTGTTTQGEPIEVRGCDLFEFKGNKIARKDSYWKLVER